MTIKTATHTPGPWSLQSHGACFNLHSPDRHDHFAILVGMNHNAEGEHEANARLIAAACTSYGKHCGARAVKLSEEDFLGGLLCMLENIESNLRDSENLTRDQLLFQVQMVTSLAQAAIKTASTSSE